jgi:transcriptional regulator with XRE-family HTH domain
MPSRGAPPRFKYEALKPARMRLGLTQRQLADRCGALGQIVDDSNISKYERGVFIPSPKALPAVAEALHLKVEDLFEPAEGGAA